MRIQQYVSLILAIIVLILSVYRYKRENGDRFIILPTVFLMIHFVIFYSYVFCRTIGIFPTTGLSTEWSVILRLHTLLTFLGYQISSIIKKKMWDDCDVCDSYYVNDTDTLIVEKE